MSITKNCLVGFAIGDALGVPVEFETRDSLANNPITSMVGHGSYDVPSGTWSDDTSMTLATMDSIIKCHDINYNDIANRFCDWINDAKYTSNNEIFDLGITTKNAIMRYWNSKDDATKCGGTGFNENGNGSLMRMMPIVLYCYYKKLTDDSTYNIVKNVSSITHAHEISILGCYIYTKYMLYILNGYDKYESYSKIKNIDYLKYFSLESVNEYDRLLKSDLALFAEDDIFSSGFIRDTLEAVIWVILQTDSYENAIIRAVNLGEDTDTIGAITGSLAGLIYGYSSIPKRWLSGLRKLNYLIDISQRFENIF